MKLYDSEIYIHDLQIASMCTVGIEKLSGFGILITGATGTIGSFIVDMLMRYNFDANANISVFAAGRSKERLAKRFDSIKSDLLQYIEHDITKPIEFDFDVDYIIHAAGNAYPSAFNSDPVGTILGNVIGTYALLEYARHHKVKRLLYISSGEVYGQGDLNLESFDELYSGYLDITSPRSCYPVSKRATETLCSSYSRQYVLETVIVRPCHTYGPSFTASDNRANVQFIRNVLNGENIVLKSLGTQMRSYCYIADCASIVLTVLINGENGQAYNSANPHARITIAGLAKIIADYAGRKVEFAAPDSVDLINRTPISRQVLSSDKVEALGWKGHFTVKKGVAHTLSILEGE